MTPNLIKCNEEGGKPKSGGGLRGRREGRREQVGEDEVEMVAEEGREESTSELGVGVEQPREEGNPQWEGR